MSILRIPLYLLTKIGSEGRGPAAAGQFLPVPRGGTSSVVEAYTGLSHSFRALEAKIAIQTLGRLSTKSNISIIIFTSIIHRAIRRSAHHPKGGVKYDRTDYDVACCA